MCAVDGLQEGTSTVWDVEGLQIDLVHSQNFMNASGGDKVKGIVARGISTMDMCYFSMLTIENVSTTFLDKTIMCSFYNGTENLTVIGETTLSFPTGKVGCVYSCCW